MERHRGPARLRGTGDQAPDPGGGHERPRRLLATTLARQIQEEALLNGTPQPAMWSTQDPVTVLGALRGASGWTRSAGCRLARVWVLRLHLLPLRAPRRGCHGDRADTVGDEHTSVSWDGTPVTLHPARHPCLSSRGRRVEDRPPPRRRPRSISPEPACWAALGGHIGATSLPEVIPCRPSQVRQ